MRWALFLVVFSLIGSASAARAQCTVSGETCNDGQYCTINDRCNTSLVCVGGGARNCSDGDPCTTDSCNESADRCDHPNAPSGTTCSDGEYCTTPDQCDGSGNCRPGPARTCDDGRDCTTDSCDEAGDRCDNLLDADACVIRGDCYVDGDMDPRTMNPCERCLPALSTNRFSQAPNGTSCGVSACSGGLFTTAPECDTTGACVPGVTSSCDSGACADVTSCVGCLADGDCGAGEYCAGTGCAALVATGESCSRDGACESGICAEGVCCTEACDGPCVTCGAAGMAGSCVSHAAGTDPELGCAGLGCDGAGACVAAVPDASTDTGVGVDSSVSGDSSVADTGGPDGGGNALTAHGSGCVACAVGGGPDGRGPALLSLSALALALGFRRRRRGRRRR